MKARGLVLLLALAHLLVSAIGFSSDLRSPPADLAWPPTTKQSKPWTRWWWPGSIVNKKDLTAEMEKYEAAGLGGLEITPIYGVKGDEGRFLNFLSPAWMKMLEHSLKEGGRLGLGIDLATGTGWPFGGPWVGADDACKNVVNRSNKPLDDWVPLQAPARSVAIFDPMLEKNGLAAVRTFEHGARAVYLQLAPGASCILKTLETAASGASFRYFTTKGGPREIRGAWSVSFMEGGPELPPAVEIRELDSWTNFGGEAVRRFSGTARYAISLDRPEGEADAWLLDLGRVRESAHVRFNGEDLATLIKSPYRILIPAVLMKETNTLEIAVSNLMANRIADMDRRKVNWKKFYNINFPARNRDNTGADGLFDASGWLPRDSGLLGPVTVTPVEFLSFEK